MSMLITKIAVMIMNTTANPPSPDREPDPMRLELDDELLDDDQSLLDQELLLELLHDEEELDE